MFYLYHSEKNRELEIGVLKENKLVIYPNKDYSQPVAYNDCYYVCEDRGLLRELAKNKRENWIKKAEQIVEEVRAVKIKNKYK